MREWEEYVTEEERVAFETCEGHRRKLGLPVEEDGVEVLELECGMEVCQYSCPFLPNPKEE